MNEKWQIEVKIISHVETWSLVSGACDQSWLKSIIAWLRYSNSDIVVSDRKKVGRNSIWQHNCQMEFQTGFFFLLYHYFTYVFDFYIFQNP